MEALIGVGSSLLLAAATYGAMHWRVGRLERDVKDHDVEDKKVSEKVDTHAQALTRQTEKIEALERQRDDFKSDVQAMENRIMSAIGDLRKDIAARTTRARK